MPKKKLKTTRNKFEQRIFEQLCRAKNSFDYENEKIPYVLARHYIPDFIVQTPTGKLYIECKGYLRPEHKAKMAAVKKQHPEIDIRFLFYADKKEQIRWAQRNGFKFAVGNIPQEWLDGF